MKVLSLSQPWLWAIMHNDPAVKKLIENRRWKPPKDLIGERIALHAAKSWDDAGIKFFCEHGIEHPQRRDLYLTSAIACVTTIASVVESVDDVAPEQRRYFFGPFGWVLSDVRNLPSPIPWKGAQGLRFLPSEAVVAIESQIARPT